MNINQCLRNIAPKLPLLLASDVAMAQQSVVPGGVNPWLLGAIIAAAIAIPIAVMASDDDESSSP